jgi:RNA polymerase sigma factor (sigma-70 family)
MATKKQAGKKSGTTRTSGESAKKSVKAAGKKAAVKKTTVAKKSSGKPVRTKTEKQLTKPAVEVVAPEVVEEMDGIPEEVRGTAEWSDMNKRMFIERMEIKKRIGRLEDKNDPSKRRELSRAKREYENLTMRIVDANYGLLRKYVKLFTGSATREDARDFEAAGRLGLMRAIDNYDPYRGSFAQWAFKPIQREVLRAVHSADHNNMNPGDFERRPEILRALKKLQGENEEFRPTEAQVAAEAGVTIEQVKRVLHAPRMDSLHTPVGDSDGAVLSDLIEDKNSLIEDAVISSIGVETLTNYGLSALDAREYFVLSRRLGLDCEPEQRLSAIGDMLKLSREAVRQIEAKAIAKMSHPVLLRLLVRNGNR